MTRYIEVQEHTTLPGMEYSPTAYPGDGAYALKNGDILFIRKDMFMTIPVMYLSGIRNYSPNSESISIHRLLDQLQELRK